MVTLIGLGLTIGIAEGSDFRKCFPMKALILWLACSRLISASVVDDFVSLASEKHGATGKKAAEFLVAHMPESDKAALSAEFLLENLDLTMRARELFPWAKDVPEEIFLNDVLPYAVFDEARDPWRAEFLKMAAPLVKDAKSASEAAQILNRDFFKLINVHYNTGRKRPNQSPKESIAQTRASCTGLSIILVNSCRAIGIPARAVGTPMWSSGRGNHTWVEIWDGGWHFTGADEYDEKGLDRGWFTADAGKADASKPEHAIYATSWKKDGGAFPMVWAEGNKQVGALDVTMRYVKASAPGDNLGIRFFKNGQRVKTTGRLVTRDGEIIERFHTKAGSADMNDMPRVSVKPGTEYRLQFAVSGKIFQTDIFTAGDGDSTRDIQIDDLQPVPEAADHLSKEEADSFIMETYEILVAERKDACQKELAAKEIMIGDKSLKWLEKTFGDEPEGGRSLWISMHGGGGTTPEVNDQQWRNQINLYQPTECIYLAPRAPTNTWNLWHEGHIDPLFSRLIESMIAFRNVNPNKVYLLGYSAGGDGVWQLAPRMADRFAAAAMMAGHPNNSSLLPLRNLPFAIFMGGADGAYDRNHIAAERTAELVALENADPGAYIHMSRIYEGLPHWMDGKDSEALPWMEKFTRDPWPRKIIWVQDDITHDRFYWLQIPEGSAKADSKIIATVIGQAIQLDGDVPAGTLILLSDNLLDLDKPVTVKVNEKPARKIEILRSAEVIREALSNRLDPAATPCAAILIP